MYTGITQNIVVRMHEHTSEVMNRKIQDQRKK